MDLKIFCTNIHFLQEQEAVTGSKAGTWGRHSERDLPSGVLPVHHTPTRATAAAFSMNSVNRSQMQEGNVCFLTLLPVLLSKACVRVRGRVHVYVLQW